jgi:hypothetical protein
MSVVLQYARAIFILKHVIIVGEGSCKLGIFLKGPPLSLFDMFLATGGGSRT